MKIFTVIFVACMLASPQLAAEIYKCTDVNGKVNYGDKPCKGASTIFTPRAGPKADEDVEARSEKTRRLLRAYEEEHAQEKQKAAELKAEKQKRLENCRRASSHYRHLLQAGRVFHANDDGSRVDFTDKERADATAGAKADIEEWCD